MHDDRQDTSARPAAATPELPLDADPVVYEERLTPSPGVWVVALLLAGLSILVFAPIDVWIGVAAAVVFLVVEVVVLVATTPRIEVREHTLQVGRAQIERRLLGRVTGHRGDSARAQRGPLLHGLAYVTVRGWISPVVRIQIEDARDVTPYWLTSTRRPEELVAALGGRMAEED